MNVSVICGMDEAGRGPLAGPVSASAVILPADFPIEILKDSKKLSEKKRFEIEKVIKQRACWAVSLVSHEVIDEINILKASLLAMKNAFEMLKEKLPEFLLNEYGENINPVLSGIVDGTFIPDIDIPCVAKPKADATYPEVMAASILAKNERDRVMVEYSLQYPEYGYAKHKGYPTADHIKICRQLGPSPIQRKSFKY